MGAYLLQIYVSVPGSWFSLLFHITIGTVDPKRRVVYALSGYPGRGRTNAKPPKPRSTTSKDQMHAAYIQLKLRADGTARMERCSCRG